MAVKIVISKPTFDATDSGLADKNKIFDSELNHLKTSSSGQILRTASTGVRYTETIAHGLGYKPLVLAYFRNTTTDSTKWFVPMTFLEVTNTRTVTQVQVMVSVDATNVVFEIYQSTGSNKDIEIQYEICYEGS